MATVWRTSSCTTTPIGRERKQKARLIVLACNGIGTPRLLLYCTSGLFNDYLAIGSGIVGQSLMFHPYAIVTGVFLVGPGGVQGADGRTDSQPGILRDRYVERVRQGLRLPNRCGARGRCIPPSAAWAVRLVPWGRDHRRVFTERFRRTMTIAVIGEDLPEVHNNVTLDSVLTDGQR